MITLLCGRGCFGAHASAMRLADVLKSPIVHAFGGNGEIENEAVEWGNPFDIDMTGLIGFRAIPCQRRPDHPRKARMPSRSVNLRLKEPSMSVEPSTEANKLPGVIFALGEQPIFRPGDAVRILTRSPIGHYRVPAYLRGKVGTVEAVIEPAAIDNEQEGFGRNAGAKLHYYRVAIPMPEIWPDYVGSPRDGLRVEIYETWLERTAQ